ncbi:MAG: glycosyltransferase family 39 protein [Ardenticatenaceae bacterium]|nr:glycosyltransferase family 39 protein [Ardenticatenaceae bacterium]
MSTRTVSAVQRQSSAACDSRARRLGAGMLALVPVGLVAAFALWGLLHTAGYSWSWDESTIVLVGRELARGGRLYDPIWWDYPPVYLWQLAALFRLTVESLAVARSLAVLWGALTIVATAALARQARGPLAAAVAALYLVLSPSFVESTRPAMTDVPAIALAMFALVAATRRGRRWAALAGVLFAVAGLTKHAVAPLAPAVVVAIVVSGAPRECWSHLGALVVAGLVTTGLVLSQLPVRAFVEQVLWFNVFYIGGAVEQATSPLTNATTIWRFVAAPERAVLAPFVLLALAGIWPALRDRRWRPAGLCALVAVLGALAMMLFFGRLYSHLIVIVLPAFAVLAGTGATWAAERVALLAAGRRRTLGVGAGLLLGILVIAFARPGDTYRHLATPEEDNKAEDGRELAAELRSGLPPGARVLSDDPMLTFLSDHAPPPTLVNVTSSRFVRDGQPSAVAMLPLLDAEPPDVIVFWTDRFLELPELLPWVQGRYELIRLYDRKGKRRLYRRLPEPRFPQEATFGEQLALRGYDLDRVAVTAGGTVTLTLSFQVLQAEARNLAFYVHLDAGDRRAAGADRPLASPELQRYPSWRAGDQVRRDVALPVAVEAAPGFYQFYVGVYNPATGDSLGRVTLARPLLLGNEAGLTAPPAVQRPSDATWEGVARLLGADVQPGSGTLDITLYWQALAQPSVNAHVFVHVLDEHGALVAQSDGVPAAGARPFIGWLPGEIIADPHRLVLPEAPTGGAYTLVVGVYDPTSLVRLPAHDPSGPLPDNAASLGEVRFP